MQYLKYIISNIKSKKIFTLLSIIQITVTMIILIQIFVNLSTSNYKERELKSNLHINLSDVYQFIVYGNIDGIENLRNEISTELSIGSFNYSYMDFEELANNKEFLEIRTKSTERRDENIPNKAMNVLNLDESIYKMLNLNIIQGRNLNIDDFKLDNNTIPILFSEKYRNVVSIDEELTFNGLETVKYKVIGFYKEGENWIPESGVEFFGLNDLGNMAIAPWAKVDKNFMLYNNLILNSTYILGNGMKKADVEKIVNDKNEKYKLNLETISITEILKRFKKENNSLVMQNLFFCIFMIISSCLGLASNMIFTIKNRTREFGIRLAMGYSKGSIKKLILSEMIFISGISTILAMIIKLTELKKNQAINIREQVLVPQFTITDFILSIIIIAVIILISIIIPLRNIDKLQPEEMIGGLD